MGDDPADAETMLSEVLLRRETSAKQEAAVRVQRDVRREGS